MENQSTNQGSGSAKSERPSLAAMAEAMGASLWQQRDASPIVHIEIDSRRIRQGEGTLFVALRSPRRDGMDFVADAYAKGVRNFLLSRPPNPQDCPDANVWVCEDTLSSLQKLATAWRKKFEIPVVAVTGSNGKTVVKEWLFQLLGSHFSVFRNPKSYNSQIGVPLSAWMLASHHEMAIFEAGISQTGEMDLLEKILSPSVGIFTNISEAHSEGFMNNRQKINEKLLLFKQVRHLIYCKDYPELNEQIVQFSHNLGRSADEALDLFTWSHKTEARLRITQLNPQPQGTRIEAIYQDEEIAIEIPFTDTASVENAIHCWAYLLLIGRPADQIAAGMAKLSSVSMRLELRKGIQDSTLINDSYNSDLTSLRIALDLLVQQSQHERFTVILSDMHQIARSDRELYEEVAEQIRQRGIDRLIGIGPALGRHQDLFQKQGGLKTLFFDSTEAFLKQVHLIRFEQEAILIKGARPFQFEKIERVLEQKIHQTVLSINLQALAHNLKAFQTSVGNETKIMAMVKAFSYGSGSYEIAHLLEQGGVQYLAVAYTEEGIALRRGGIRLPIMVMSADLMSYDRMIAWNLEPELYSLLSLDQFQAMARNLDASAFPVHIKLDTGMHRLGFEEEDLDDLIQRLKASKELKVASIFSHLAASEDPMADAFTQEQAQRFDRMRQKIIEGLGYRPICHLANSAAIGRHPDLHYDMVRVGLGLYGIGNAPHPGQPLIPIATLRTTIAQIRHLNSGQRVGYGLRGKLERDATIGVISIGYADGFPRSLGNGRGQVWIQGKAVPTVGEVCMDMCMVDLTGLDRVEEGQEVILFGPQQPLTDLARQAGQIPYELMTGISPRVKRIYVTE